MKEKTKKNTVIGIASILIGLAIFLSSAEAVFNTSENLSRAAKSFVTTSYKTPNTATRDCGDNDSSPDPMYWFCLEPMKLVSPTSMKNINMAWELGISFPENADAVSPELAAEFWTTYADKCSEFGRISQSVFELRKPEAIYCEWVFYHIAKNEMINDPSVVYGHAKMTPSGSFYSLGDMLKTHYYLLCIGIIIIMFGAGFLRQSPRLLAVLIGEDGRFSLARLQMSCWSIILFASVTLYACLNAGIISLFPSQIGRLDVFPIIPLELILLMGISISTPALAFFIKHVQSSGTKTLGIQPVKYDNPSRKRKPEWSDFFTIQAGDNEGELDFSALQNFFITLLLASYYLMIVTSVLNGFDFNAVISSWTDETRKALLPGLPQVGNSFTALALVSHSAYLITMGAQSDTKS